MMERLKWLCLPLQVGHPVEDSYFVSSLAVFLLLMAVGTSVITAKDNTMQLTSNFNMIAKDPVMMLFIAYTITLWLYIRMRRRRILRPASLTSRGQGTGIKFHIKYNLSLIGIWVFLVVGIIADILKIIYNLEQVTSGCPVSKAEVAVNSLYHCCRMAYLFGIADLATTIHGHVVSAEHRGPMWYVLLTLLASILISWYDNLVHANKSTLKSRTKWSVICNDSLVNCTSSCVPSEESSFFQWTPYLYSISMQQQLLVILVIGNVIQSLFSARKQSGPIPQRQASRMVAAGSRNCTVVEMRGVKSHGNGISASHVQAQKKTVLQMPLAFVLGILINSYLIVYGVLAVNRKDGHLKFLIQYYNFKLVYFAVNIGLILWAYYLSYDVRPGRYKLKNKKKEKVFLGMDILIMVSSFGCYMRYLLHVYALFGYLGNARSIDKEDPPLHSSSVFYLILADFSDIAMTFMKSTFMFYCTQIVWPSSRRPNMRLLIHRASMRWKKHWFKEVVLFLALESLTWWVLKGFVHIIGNAKGVTYIQNYFYDYKSWTVMDSLTTPFIVFFNFNAFFILFGAYLKQ